MNCVSYRLLHGADLVCDFPLDIKCFVCKKGRFHYCNELCVGQQTGQTGVQACCISGLSKEHSYHSAEDTKTPYWGSGMHIPRGGAFVSACAVPQNTESDAFDQMLMDEYAAIKNYIDLQSKSIGVRDGKPLELSEMKDRLKDCSDIMRKKYTSLTEESYLLFHDVDMDPSDFVSSRRPKVETMKKTKKSKACHTQSHPDPRKGYDDDEFTRIQKVELIPLVKHYTSLYFSKKGSKKAEMQIRGAGSFSVEGDFYSSDTIASQRQQHQRSLRASLVMVRFWRQDLPFCVKPTQYIMTEPQRGKSNDLIYFNSLSTTLYLKCVVTVEEFAIQLWWMNLSKHVESIISRRNAEQDPKFAKKLERFLLLIRIAEVTIKTILPGFVRLSEYLQYSNSAKCQYANCRQYAEHCILTHKPLYYDVLESLISHDSQFYNLASPKHLYDMDPLDYIRYANSMTRVPAAILIDWPTATDMWQYLSGITALWVLVNCAGSNEKARRKTKDPLEIVLGGIYMLACDGLVCWRPWNSHIMLIPTFAKMKTRGYITYLNLLSAIKDGSQCHKEGIKIIQGSLMYLVGNGIPAPNVYDFIVDMIMGKMPKGLY